MAMIKCVKQQSYTRDIEEIREIARRYQSAKNYFYSRYSGIKSLNKIDSHRKEIRDVLVKEKICDMFGLPARYWKIALDEVISNIKSNWSNTKERIKVAITNNKNLSKEEQHYLRYILKSNELLYSILNREDFKELKGLSEIEINNDRKPYLLNLLRRYVRKYKNKIPKSTDLRSFQIDADMYEYIYKEDGLYIEIAGLKPRKRILFKLKDHYRYRGNLNIILDKHDNFIKIHKGLSVETKILDENHSNIVGVDKGYTKMLSCSNGIEYGTELGRLLSQRTEELNEKNKIRNKLYALAKKYTEEGNDKKAQNILKNNLGYKKKDRQTRKFKARAESYINHEINVFIEDSKPREVVKEDLTFTAKKRDKKSKAYNRKMSQWVKGVLDKRLEYKLQYSGIKVTDINASYTSQVCNKCGRFGIRDNDLFTCPHCGTMDANINASKNILKRRDDKEITKYMKYQKVKEILENRVPKPKTKEMNGQLVFEL